MDERELLLKEIRELRNIGYDSWVKAHDLYNQAIKLWQEGGYSGLISTPNSRFFQSFLNEFQRFPQMFYEKKDLNNS